MENNGIRIAWTEREGPGRPPVPNRPLAVAVAGVLATVFSAMLFTDTLCPEHRAWVQALAAVAMVGIVVAVVGLVRQWASAAAWALGSAACGVAIGVLDAAHAPGRGRLIAAAFAVVAVAAAALVVQHLRLGRWAARLERTVGAAVDASLLTTNDPVAPRPGAADAAVPAKDAVPHRVGPQAPER